jgi:hypothetical protein
LSRSLVPSCSQFVTETSKSKAIDDTTFQGTYKLSHSWVTVSTTVQTNNTKCVFKGILIGVSGLKISETHFLNILHTCQTADILISHPSVTKRGLLKARFPSLMKIQLLISIPALAQWPMRVNQKVKAIFKLCSNRDREELAHCQWQCLLKSSAICTTALCLQSSGSNEGENMDAPVQDCTIREQRGVMQFLWAEGVKPVEIHLHTLVPYGLSTMSQRKVYEWVERFKLGQTCVTDEGGSGRPSTSHTSRAAKKLLLRRNTETSRAI